MNTPNKTIANLAAELAGDPAVENKVEVEIAFNAMVSRLLAMRVAQGVTQQQLAKAMGCNPSKVSRMESGNDSTLKWMDVVCYIGALNMDMHVSFEDPSLPAADRIKHCVSDISEHLEELTTLAAQVGGNDEIAKKIHQFSGEVLLNFLVRYMDHSAKLRSVLKIPSSHSAQIAMPHCHSEVAAVAKDHVMA